MTDAPARPQAAAGTAADARDARTNHRRVPVPKLLLFGLPLNLLAITGGCWMLINAFVILDETAPLAVIALSSINLVVLVLLTRRIIKMRAVEEQRRYVRVDLELSGELDGEPCRVTELSLGGCHIELSHETDVRAGQDVKVRFGLDALTFELESSVLGTGVTHNGKHLLRVRFKPGQNGYIERLAIGLLTDSSATSAA